MTFIPDKPSHRRFVFNQLNQTQYKTYANQYSKAKRGGFRCVYAWASGSGVISVIGNIGKGRVIDYGKKKFAAVCISAGVFILSPAVVVFTNATKIVKVSKSIHGVTAFLFECVEDSSNLAFLPLDMAFFGQPIPVGTSDRFNLFVSNHTDFLDI